MQSAYTAVHANFPFSFELSSAAAVPVLNLLRWWFWGFSHRMSDSFDVLGPCFGEFWAKKHQKYLNLHCRSTPLVDFGEICVVYIGTVLYNVSNLGPVRLLVKYSLPKKCDRANTSNYQSRSMGLILKSLHDAKINGHAKFGGNCCRSVVGDTTVFCHSVWLLRLDLSLNTRLRHAHS